MEEVQKPLIAQGWLRALIYFVAVSIIVYAFQIAASSLMNQFEAGSEVGDESVKNFGILYSIMGAVILLVTWVMRKYIDRKSFQSLGFNWKGYSNEAALGFFSALAMLGVGSIILVAMGYLSFVTVNANIGPLMLEFVIMTVVASVEELLFRGYLLNNLLESMNKWLALVISAVLFALFHAANPDVTVLAVVNILLAGIFIGLNYIFTKNLWYSIFFHFAWNYFQGPVLGYDVSGLKLSSLVQQSMSGPPIWTGGSFGFEGSLLCPLLFVAAILFFSFAFRSRYE